MKALRADSPVRIQPPETCPHDRIYTWFPRLIANDPNSPTLACRRAGRRFRPDGNGRCARSIGRNWKRRCAAELSS